MENKVESWWVLPASLAPNLLEEPFTAIVFTTFAILALLAWLATSFICWFYPGGPAWGKYYLFSRRTSASCIHGPRGFPLIGSMNLLSGLSHRRLAYFSARYPRAKRLMAFSVGETRMIVTSHPEVAKEITNSPVFADRPFNECAYTIMFHRAIGFAPHGAYWRTLRRVAAAHIFSPKSFESLAPYRSRIADAMVVRIIEQGEGSFQVRRILKRASLCYIMDSVFGKRYTAGMSGDGVEELLGVVEEGYELLGVNNWNDHLPLLSKLDLQGIRFRCSDLVPRIYNFVYPIVNDRRVQVGKRDSPDFLDALLSLDGCEALTDTDIAAILWEMVFRGTDTMAVMMEWALARLMLHQEIQSKIHKELDVVIGHSETMTDNDIQRLPYLQAFLKEVLRLHPPGPLLAWRRQSTSDTFIDGRFVPAGTTAMVNMWAISRDPNLWVQPLEFRPERFQHRGNCSGEFSIFGNDLRLAPFGSGKRSCPGKGLAWSTVCFWMATLLHEFQWHSPMEKSNIDFSEFMRLSCEMATPLEAKVSSRCHGRNFALNLTL